MNSVDKLFKLADRFARKISLAEDKLPMPAQPGDIQDALANANLWGVPDNLFALADQAGLDADVNVATFINIDQNLNVTFKVTTSPAKPAQAAKFTTLLQQTYSESFKTAIQSHFQKYKIIPRPQTAAWHKFGPKK